MHFPARFVLLALALGIAGLARSATPPPLPAVSPPNPNIVFIIADDLGWADVAFHGGRAPTPHLDRLAREGLELGAHYVAPVCSPTRTGLMTGRCWSRVGVTSPQNDRALPWDTVTLPRALKARGYDTCLTGKWHLGSLPSQGPNHFGFDHSYGSLAGGVSPYGHKYKQGPFVDTWHRDEKLLDEPGHVTDLLAAEAVKWIEGRGASPFFLYVPFTAVHLPVKEPAEWLARVPAAITGDVPRHYAACVMHLDDAVGRIVAALERTGKRANTLLVFTSDNGGSTVENNDRTYPSDDCPSGKLTGSNTPWRGEKGSLYEGGTRVPTLVSWPGRAKPGKVDAPVHITDWMPTFAALAGYKPERDLKWDGTDIGALLTAHTPPPERTLYGVAPGWRAQAVRRGDWKLVVTAASAANAKKQTAARPATEELFHLATDPAEANNLAPARPEILAQMRAHLAAASARDRDAMARD
ncbi:MAG: sulfatase-like hydrolase/transferase [Verrucomicrobia bacterium]|nr:sulfatase-like hydrolase/transferase [Verrucomicrobiota bacterium]